jgi:transcriptional regulator with XRE-family HTH domain
MAPSARLARQLRVLRKRRRLTQETLARRAGVSREHIARLEAGLHDPRLSMLQRIAAALEVSVARLVT